MRVRVRVCVRARAVCKGQGYIALARLDVAAAVPPPTNNAELTSLVARRNPHTLLSFESVPPDLVGTTA